MRTWILGTACAAVVALVCPHLAAAAIVRIGTGTAVEVGTTATKLDDASVPNTGPRYIVVCNPSGNGLVHIGGASVTTANGLPLRPGDCWVSGDRVDPAVSVYAIAASTQTVRVQEYL